VPKFVPKFTAIRKALDAGGILWPGLEEDVVQLLVESCTIYSVNNQEYFLLTDLQDFFQNFTRCIEETIFRGMTNHQINIKGPPGFKVVRGDLCKREVVLSVPYRTLGLKKWKRIRIPFPEGWMPGIVRPM
jgi:hypothetical protein